MSISKQVISKTSINNYFGYSVAQHFIKSKKSYFILVGAPRETYLKYTSGAIYKCPITFNSNDCTLVDVLFNTTSIDEYRFSDGKPYDSILKEQALGANNNDQWLGVSVASTGSGAFTACGHRYTHNYNFSNFDETATYGACYSFNNDLIQEYKHIPCLKMTGELKLYQYNYVYCQTGIGLHLDEANGVTYPGQNTFLTMGMPTALNFRGISYTVELSKASLVNYIYKNDSSYCNFLYKTDSEVAPTIGHCSDIWSVDSYLGFSTVLISNKGVKGYIVASSAPRQRFNGAIHFFNVTTTSSGESITYKLPISIKGKTRGAYFGYSMNAIDVNGDGLKDLIVGAPYFTEKYSTDRGAIYIYMQKSVNEFSTEASFSYHGNKKSKFGTSITSLGDIDNDGINDFAVGAPFETNSKGVSSGAVYIFRGASDPNDIKLSQIIFAEDVSQNKIERFGESLSGGMDMDGNNYPDLAIGAFQSNTVFLTRTYPILNLKAFISNIDDLQEIDQIECTKQKLVGKSCFSLNLCFQILENKRNKLNKNLPLVNYKLIGDSKQRFSRIVFNKTHNEKYENKIDINNLLTNYCESIDIYLNSNINDYLTPISINIDFKFDEQIILNNNNLNDINMYPVLNKELSNTDFEVKFKRDCGHDHKCTTDISLNATLEHLNFDENDGDYLISYKEIDTIVLRVVVDNTKLPSEPSYGTIVNINFDKRLDFVKLERTDSLLIDYHLNSSDPSHLICSITNAPGLPFLADTKTEFIIKFGTYNLTRNTQNKLVKIDVGLRTLSNDINLSDNDISLRAKLVIKTNIQIYSKQTPEQVFYNDKIRGESAMQTFDNIGPIIEHVYLVNNLGPFSINYFKMKFYWPYELNPSNSNDKYGKRLLYLTEKPLKIPNNHPINVVCNESSFVVDPIKINEISNSRLLKRSINEDLLESQQIKLQGTAKKPLIDCFTNTARCHVIDCDFYGDLLKGETIQLKFIARLWNSTLAEDFNKVESVMIASNGELILNDTVSDSKREYMSTAVTIAYSQISVGISKPVSKWIYIGSTLSGFGILSICIFAFWMMGFFERKKLEGLAEENVRLRKQGDQ